MTSNKGSKSKNSNKYKNKDMIMIYNKMNPVDPSPKCHEVWKVVLTVLGLFSAQMMVENPFAKL